MSRKTATAIGIAALLLAPSAGTALAGQDRPGKPDRQLHQCEDGVDNDGDGATDVGADAGCGSARDNSEDSETAEGPGEPGGLPGLPPLPELPPGGGAPELPPLPEIPPGGGAPELPPLPELPPGGGAPELPPLPEIPPPPAG